MNCSISLRLGATGFAAAAALLQPLAARAAEDDSEFWIQLAAQGEAWDGATLKLNVEQRRKSGDDEYIAAADFAVDTAENLALGGGLEVHDTGGFTEIRPYQQVLVEAGPFDFRTKFEQRFFESSDQMGLRIRQRARFTQPLGPKTRGRLSAELLYQLRDRTEGGPKRIDQWRFAAGVEHRATQTLSVWGGYQLVIRPRGANTRHTHVPQLYVTYRF